MFRVAQQADRKAVTLLFSQVFGDSVEFAETVFDTFAGANNVFIAQQGDTVISALFSVPVSLLERQGVYFYGLCTHPDHRGKNTMTDLMDYAKTVLVQRGKTFAVLIPASESLFDYYKARGFETAFALRYIRRPIRNNLWAQAEFDTITAKTLAQLRQTYAPRSVQFESAGYIAVLTDLYSGGITTVYSDEGYGLYFKKGDTLEFIELFAEGDRGAEKLIEAARQKTPAEDAVITLGAGETLFLGEGVCKDYGMIQFWEERFGVEDTYMRLMLDNEG